MNLTHPEKPKSELELLLEKNAYGEGLNKQEKHRALDLILNPEYTNENCWVCELHKSRVIEKTITIRTCV